MEFRVMGPLVVSDEDTTVELGTPRIRLVCGILLARPSDLVAVEQFVDELWPTRPPPNARTLMHGYVSRLRRALGSGADRVVSRKPGYLLRVEDQELDLDRFDRLVAEARAARQAGEPSRADDLFGQAHRLWRGEPFADVPRSTSIEMAATWWTERRLAVAEERFDAALATGRAADLITELTEFVTAHPMRERPAGQLMLALYRCGRQAEALARYQRTRRALAEEVGVEPGAELRQLHQRILDVDPTLSTPRAATVTVRVPRQLPRDLATFVGRDPELAELTTVLAQDDAPVVVVHGAPGVGKSALVVRAAHASADRFPDGQLHVNLCGATAGIAPLSPTEALYRLLRALGVAAGDLPADAEEAAGLFRTVVAERRLLILLDNAATAAQVRPLLPGGGNAVLVTSRTRLSTLEGATHRQLDPLSPDAAHAMLDGLVPGVRTAVEPAATRQLAELCDHLPLGLHIAAARLNARSGWAVGDLVARLVDERHRLGELAAGDIALRSSLMVSHAALQDSDNPTDRAAAHALSVFGVLPVTGIDLELAAAALDTTVPDTDRIVERLLDAHLVEEHQAARFFMHDLTRLFARDLAAGTLLPDERHAALSRVLRHYLATTCRANELAYPHRSHHPAPDAGRSPAPLTNLEDSLRWLDEQRRNMVAVVRQALVGPAEHARLGVGLALALHWYLYTGADDMADTTKLYAEILEGAERLGDRQAQAYAHCSLASSLTITGQEAEATAHHLAELALCRELGDRFGEQRALGNLGGSHLIRHSPAEAIPFLQQQLELATDIGASTGRAFALVYLGNAHHQLGHLDEAVQLVGAGLAWYEEVGDHLRHCDARERLARIHIDLGQLDKAIALSTAGLDDARRHSYRDGEIWALILLATAWRLTGDTDRARQYAELAMTASRDLHDTQVRRDALAEYEKLRPTHTPG